MKFGCILFSGSGEVVQSFLCAILFLVTTAIFDVRSTLFEQTW